MRTDPDRGRSEAGRRGRRAVPALVLLSAWAAAPESTLRGAGPAHLLEVRTRYQTLLVVEDADRRERYLCGPGCGYVHGTLRLDAPDELAMEYMRTALAGLAFLPRAPRRALFLGMGAGLMPRYLRARLPSARVDVVEIDPEVPPLARRFFRFREDPRLKVHVADAAEFVGREKGPWDLVVLDALYGPEVPAHLAAEPFLRLVRQRLAPGGVLVANLAPPALAPGTPALLDRIAESGFSVTVFPTVEGSNWIAVATLAPSATDAVLERARRLDRDLGDLGLQAIVSRPGRFSVPPR